MRRVDSNEFRVSKAEEAPPPRLQRRHVEGSALLKGGWREAAQVSVEEAAHGVHRRGEILKKVQHF